MTAPIAPGDTLGFVGLGRMGQQMSALLRDAGYDVRGYDIDDSARQAFADAGGKVADDLAGVGAGARAVLLMLPTSAIVSSVLVEHDLLGALEPGTLVVDMGSSQPETTRELAAVAEQRGLRLVDAPVSGGVKGAREGALTIMAGGHEEWVAEIAAPLGVMGKKAVHVGPVGAGHALKALNNLLSASHLVASSEAIAIGAKFGLDPAAMVDAINGSSGKNWSTEMKFPTYVLPGTFNSGFALSLLVKDTRIAVELARSTGVPAEHAEATLALWERAMEELPADADHTEIFRWVEKRRAQ